MRADAVIGFQRDRHHVSVERDWITLTDGIVSTLHYMVQAFCQPGDSVMLNTPVYDPFAMATERQGVKVLANPLSVVMVVDEVHAEHLLEGKFVSCLTPESADADNLILLTSPNKALNMGD